MFILMQDFLPQQLISVTDKLLYTYPNFHFSEFCLLLYLLSVSNSQTNLRVSRTLECTKLLLCTGISSVVAAVYDPI